MNQWRLWQLADSAFPTGGFAHSGGLEAAYQLGWVIDGPSLVEFLNSAARQAERDLLRFSRRAWREPERFSAIDREVDLYLNNHVANRASRAQGSAMLASAARVFQIDTLTTLAEQARRQRTPSHFAPVFGVVSRVVGFEELTAMNLLLFVTARSIVSAAVRLGIVGPIEAQQIQANLQLTPELDEDEPVQISPMLSLVQGRQDRLYSRLFQS